MTSAKDEAAGTRPKCEVCEQVEPRYRCPRCQTRTCSLPCVKRHKAETSCSGVRDKTAFVKVSQFTHLNLLNDYRFLEDVGRKSDNTARDTTNTQAHIPWHLKTLVTQVRKRGATLQLLPKTFSKRQKNLTKYFYATGRICWTVEWVFPQAEAKHFDRHIDTNTVKACLETVYDPLETDSVVRHALRAYVKRGIEGVTLLLKKEQCPANNQTYYRLDPAKTLQKSLREKVIIEFPTIHVVFNEQLAGYQLQEEVMSEGESDPEVNIKELFNGESAPVDTSTMDSELTKRTETDTNANSEELKEKNQDMEVELENDSKNQSQDVNIQDAVQEKAPLVDVQLEAGKVELEDSVQGNKRRRRKRKRGTQKVPGANSNDTQTVDVEEEDCIQTNEGEDKKVKSGDNSQNQNVKLGDVVQEEPGVDVKSGAREVELENSIQPKKRKRCTDSVPSTNSNENQTINVEEKHCIETSDVKGEDKVKSEDNSQNQNVKVQEESGVEIKSRAMEVESDESIQPNKRKKCTEGVPSTNSEDSQTINVEEKDCIQVNEVQGEDEVKSGGHSQNRNVKLGDMVQEEPKVDVQLRAREVEKKRCTESLPSPSSKDDQTVDVEKKDIQTNEVEGEVKEVKSEGDNSQNQNVKLGDVIQEEPEGDVQLQAREVERKKCTESIPSTNSKDNQNVDVEDKDCIQANEVEKVALAERTVTTEDADFKSSQSADLSGNVNVEEKPQGWRAAHKLLREKMLKNDT